MTDQPNIKINVETAAADLDGVQSIANIAVRIFHEYCHEVGIDHEIFEELLSRCGPSVFQMIQACGELAASIQLQELANELSGEASTLMNKAASIIAVNALDTVQGVQHHLPKDSLVKIMSVHDGDGVITTTLDVDAMDEQETS